MISQFISRRLTGKAKEPKTMKSISDNFSREPAIDDVLADPTVKVLMARDSVREEDLRCLIVRAQTALTARTTG